MEVSGQLYTPAALTNGNFGRYLPHRRFGGTQRRSGSFREEEISFPRGNRTTVVQPHGLVTIPIELWFLMLWWNWNKMYILNHTLKYFNLWIYFIKVLYTCRSQWPRGLSRRSAAARLLGLWVRIPPGAWMFVCCECCVLSGRGLCDKLITRPEESYRLWCVAVCDLETSRMMRPWPAFGRSVTEKKIYIYIYIYIYIHVLCYVSIMKVSPKSNESRI